MNYFTSQLSRAILNILPIAVPSLLVIGFTTAGCNSPSDTNENGSVPVADGPEGYTTSVIDSATFSQIEQGINPNSGLDRSTVIAPSYSYFTTGSIDANNDQAYIYYSIQPNGLPVLTGQVLFQEPAGLSLSGTNVKSSNIVIDSTRCTFSGVISFVVNDSLSAIPARHSIKLTLDRVFAGDFNRRSSIQFMNVLGDNNAQAVLRHDGGFSIGAENTLRPVPNANPAKIVFDLKGLPSGTFPLDRGMGTYQLIGSPQGASLSDTTLHSNPAMDSMWVTSIDTRTRRLSANFKIQGHQGTIKDLLWSVE